MIDDFVLFESIYVGIGEQRSNLTADDVKSLELGDLRLYWKVNSPDGDSDRDKQTGFTFVVLEWSASDDHGEWFRVATEGTAFWDGIRHMTFFPAKSGGDLDSQGYTNYPDVGALARVMSFLRELEMEHCSRPTYVE